MEIEQRGEKALVLVLSRKDIESVLAMRETIAAVEEAFKELGSGTAVMPTRVGLPVSDRAGWLGAMPAYLSRAGAMATKIVTSYDNNPTRHRLPTVMAVVILNDPETGRVEALLEGTFITAMRTGAVSAVATSYLARHDAHVIGIFGAGVQARTQLEAIKEVRDLQSALVYDIVPGKRRLFAEEMSVRLGIDVLAEDSPDRVVGKSDIIVTSSTSKTPIFNGELLRNGTHINAIGSFKPDARELDDSTILRSKIVVDSLQAALEEAGDIVIPLRSGVIQRKQVYAELGEIVAGLRPGRENELEITVFKSVGLGIQDAAAANLAYRKAKEAKIGKIIDLADEPAGRTIR